MCHTVFHSSVCYLDQQLMRYMILLLLFVCLLHREDKMDNFSRFVRSLDDSIRHLYCVGDANAKRHRDCKLMQIEKICVICSTLLHEINCNRPYHIDLADDDELDKINNITITA